MGGLWATVASATALALASAAAAHAGDLGPHDDGATVRLRGPTLTVSLPTNAGTGYHWEFDAAASRGIALKQRTTGAAPPPPAPDGRPVMMVGGPVTTRFTLQATAKSGEARIGLFPPGPPGAAPNQVWRVSFTRARHATHPAPPAGGAHP